MLDVGSGTGHNALALGAATSLDWVEADVADLHAVGRGPTLFDGVRLPFRDDAFDAAVALFVFQYPRYPERLLREVARVTAGPAIVLQSTYRGPWALARLEMREALTGRLARNLARAVGFIRSGEESLKPRRYYTRRSFHALVERAGMRIAARESEGRGALSRDLYVIERLGA